MGRGTGSGGREREKIEEGGKCGGRAMDKMGS